MCMYTHANMHAPKKPNNNKQNAKIFILKKLKIACLVFGYLLDEACVYNLYMFYLLYMLYDALFVFKKLV